MAKVGEIDIAEMMYPNVLRNSYGGQMKIHDISTLTNPGIPIWPNTPGFKIWRSLDQELGNEVTSSTILTDVHCGTHIDAPLHFIRDGCPVSEVNLNSCIGPSFVVDFRGIKEIEPSHLAKQVPQSVERLLLKTDNSELWPRSTFNPEFSALTFEGAEWIARRKLKLVGIDYLSIQLFNGENRTHTVLMDAGVVILESLDLGRVSEGFYELICLPLLIEHAEAAPARAILIES
jgi:arylformamidase